jgi:hypothetical protein
MPQERVGTTLANLHRVRRPPLKKLLLRLLLAVAFGCAILWPLYLAAGNLWLHEGGLERMLNRRPERLSIHWKSAWTLWPGVVHVRGFELRNQTRTFQWWVAVDRGTVDVDLWNLQDRELLLGPVSGTGAVFRLRRRLDTPPRSRPGRPELYPPIPGLANPPAAKPELLYPPKPGPKRNPWHVQITGLNLDDVREVWIEEVRFAGQARVAGGFDVRARERVEVEPSRVEILAGTLGLGAGTRARPILADARGRLDGRIEPYAPQKFKGWQVFNFTSGRVTLEGQVHSLAFLDVFFRETRWVDLRFGGGRTTTDLRLRRGEILPGSSLEARPEGITVSFLDYRAQGDGSVRWWVEREKGATTGKIALALDHFRIQREGYGRPHVRGRGLRLEAASDRPRIGGLFDPRWVAIDMAEAEVPDLRFYNAYLPARSGLTLTGGSGRMSARFRAAAPAWIGTGEMRLTAQGLGARFQEKRLRGNLALHTLLRRADLREKRFDIGGSKIDLTDVVSLDAPPGEAPGSPWWARAHFDNAVLAPGSPVFLRARVESTLSDTRPLFALVAPAGGRGKVLHWVDDLLDIQGIGATADLTVGRSFLGVDHLAVAGGKAQVQGRFQVADGQQRGILYAALGRLDVGLELADGKRDWKILHPRKWFANYPAFE